jgi:hypothetical protein
MVEHFLIILFQIDSLEIINKAKGLQFILICSDRKTNEMFDTKTLTLTFIHFCCRLKALS